MTLEEIKKTIEEHVPDSTAHVMDPMNDGQHLQAIVISSTFEGMLLIKQHRLVKNAMKDALQGEDVHALSIKTFTPEKWDMERTKFGF